MLGSAKCRVVDDPITVSLDDLVPPDHFYRHLDTRLDLSFIREWVADAYPSIGRPSVDPVVVFKLYLVMVFEGIRSERQLLMLAADRLSVRWYLGDDLDEPLPDHSSLTRIRDRYGIDIFRRFFDTIVEQRQRAGLVWGQELYLDATIVEANASLDSLVPRFAVDPTWTRCSPTVARAMMLTHVCVHLATLLRGLQRKQTLVVAHQSQTGSSATVDRIVASCADTISGGRTTKPVAPILTPRSSIVPRPDCVSPSTTITSSTVAVLASS